MPGYILPSRMIGLSNARDNGSEGRLLTHSGRVVCVRQGRLACADLVTDSDPLSVSFLGGRVSIYVHEDQESDIFEVETTTTNHLSAEVQHVLRKTPIRQQPAGFFGLSCSGHPVVVDQEGFLVAGVQGAEPEAFICCSQEEADFLRYFLKNSWIERGSGTLIRREDVSIEKGLTFCMGTTRFSYSDIVDSCARSKHRGSTLPKDLIMRFDGWKVRRYSLFRPLVYLVAFGKEAIFDCAELAIMSLFEFGDFSGDVLVMTDATHAGFPLRFPKSLQDRVKTIVVEADDALDYMSARFLIADISLAFDYQPIIYIDTDIVVDGTLTELLKGLTVSDRIHLVSEGAGTALQKTNYYGQKLFDEDAEICMDGKDGFNSGVIGFRNVESAAPFFENILESIHAYALASNSRIFFPAADQAMANYVLYRQDILFKDLIRPYVVLANHTQPLPTETRRGLIHFLGGVGNAVPKLVQMTSYLESIRLDQLCKDTA